MTEPGRRTFLFRLTLLPLAAGAWADARAGETEFAAAIRAFAGGQPIGEGRVSLFVEPLVDNGNSVPVRVTVDSPMTEADHVAAIALFTEKNPQTEVAVFRLSPVNGRAEAATRLRLAGTQRIAALARLSDGRVIMKQAEVIVTAAACAEDT